MNIINKKVQVYKIYCDLDKNVRVRQFAEKHAAVGTVVETRAHDSLLNKNVRVTVTFRSTDRETAIYRAFLEEFKAYDTEINKRSMSIYKEAGL